MIETLILNPTWIVVLAIAVVGLGWKLVRWGLNTNLKIESQEDVISEVRTDIKEIKEGIKYLFKRLPSTPIESASPVKLNDFGEKISSTMKVKSWAKIHAPNLVNEIKGKEEFEIFNLCEEYVSRKFGEDSEFQRTIRSGAYEIGTELIHVLKVYQVELRDKLLEENK